MQFIVIGDAILDLSLDCHETRESREIPGSSIHVARDAEALLGGAGNVASLLAAHHQVTFLAAIGGWTGAMIRDLCHEQDIRLLEAPREHPNPVKVRVSHWGTYCQRYDVECAEFSADALERLLDQLPDRPTADAVVLADYRKGLFHPNRRAAIERILAWGVPVIADPKPPHARLLRGAYAVTPNLREGRAIAMRGDDEVPAMVRSIMKCQLAVVTCGSDGAIWESTAGSGRVPGAAGGPWIVGAGDAFTAALAEAIASGASDAAAVSWANAQAALYTCGPPATAVTL